MSEKAFDPIERRFKSIVLISDGEDHDVDIKNRRGCCSAWSYHLYCRHRFSQGSQIPDSATGGFKRDAMGNIVISKLNEDGLRQIAQKTNGVYIHFESSEQAVNELMQQLSQVEKKAFTDVSLLNNKSYYTWFAGLMLLLLHFEFVLPEREQKRA